MFSVLCEPAVALFAQLLIMPSVTYVNIDPDSPRRRPCLNSPHDPARSSRRPRRPCLSGRRLVVRLPRLFPVDPPGSEIQLPLRQAAGRRGAAVRHQGAAVPARRRGGDQADPSGDHLRQVGEFVPPRALSALQGAPARPAARSRAAVPADARDGRRLRPHPDRAGPLRGRRPHRHLRDAGARQGRRRADRFGRQGPDAARRPGRGDVRPGFRRPRGAAHRPGRGRRLFRPRRRQGRRHPGARRRLDRQRARRAGHRRQDGGATDRRIRRPRHAARARRRDQAAEAARDADRPGERQAHPPVEATGEAGHRRRGRRAARRARNAQARRPSR